MRVFGGVVLMAATAAFGVTEASARSRAAAPIEYAARAERPAQTSASAPTRPAVARTAPGRPAATLDLPEMLYGYGRHAPVSGPVLDLRGRLTPVAADSLLAEQDFEAPSSDPGQSEFVEGEAAPSPEPTAEPAPPAQVAAAAAEGVYFLQIGAFGDPANVERARAALGGLGAVSVDLRQGAGATLHRVKLGGWTTRSEAEQARLRVAGLGYVDARVAGGP